LRAGGLHHLVDAAELHAGAAKRLALGLLGGVDRLPAAIADDGIGLALGKQFLDRAGAGVRGLRNPVRREVLEQVVDRLLGVLLVGPDDPARTPLDPADDVLALDLGALLIEDAAALVADHAAL
jgi:hypothetical protein